MTLMAGGGQKKKKREREILLGTLRKLLHMSANPILSENINVSFFAAQEILDLIFSESFRHVVLHKKL